MRTTIDKAGRVVVPKALRDAVGMTAGEVEIEIDGDGLHVAPVVSSRLVRDGDGRLVIRGGPSMTPEEIRDLRLGLQR